MVSGEPLEPVGTEPALPASPGEAAPERATDAPLGATLEAIGEASAGAPRGIERSETGGGAPRGIERSETGGGDPDGSAGGAGGSVPRGIERSETGGGDPRGIDPSWRVRRAALAATRLRSPADRDVAVPPRARAAAEAVLAAAIGVAGHDAVL